VILAAASSTPTLLVELGVVLVVLGVAGRLAHRVGISPIPLYLLAGLALGEGGVAELVTARDFIETGAAIGVVLLLLVLGLDYSGEELVAGLRANRRAGLVDFVLNATPGFAAALLFGWGATAAVFLGGITYISSSGVVAKLLEDLGRIGNRETPTVLSILIVEDLVMAVYLPVAAGLAIATGVVETVADITIALAAVAVAFAISLRFGATLSRLVFSPSDELLLLTVLGGGVLVAGGAEHLGAPAAVAALLLGIALSGSTATNARALLTPLRDVFAAVFFVFFGLTIDPGLIPGALPEAAALAVVTGATKVVTGVWAASRAGVRVAGQLRAGTALVARGEFSIIIAGLAFAEGVEPRLPAVAAAYVLILAGVAPVLTRLADPLAGWIQARSTVRA
jgi:CPA2 family monovalent cation:H+ antiporter-2